MKNEMKEIYSNQILETELSKFSTLCSELKYALPMFSELIDSRWHQLIQCGYKNLPIHDSTIKTDEVEEIQWIKDYENNFGKLDETWFMDKNGTLDSESYTEYLISGKVCALYNCVGRST